MKISKQLWKNIFKLEEISKNLNVISGKSIQVNWPCLTLVKPYEVKPLRRSSE